MRFIDPDGMDPQDPPQDPSKIKNPYIRAFVEKNFSQKLEAAGNSAKNIVKGSISTGFGGYFKVSAGSAGTIEGGAGISATVSSNLLGETNLNSSAGANLNILAGNDKVNVASANLVEINASNDSKNVSFLTSSVLNNVSRSSSDNNAKASLSQQGDIGLGAQIGPVGVTATINPTNIIKAVGGYLNAIKQYVQNVFDMHLHQEKHLVPSESMR